MSAKTERTRSLLDQWRSMLRIRRFEETVARLLAEGTLGGTTHLCIGQEAVPVGVCSVLEPGDQVVSNHRGHGHLLAKGADPGRLLAELAGRADGYCRGKGGSQHVAVPEIGFMGSNGITGGGLPIACGLALAARLRGTGALVVAFMGDGAATTGNFHETCNLAALWRLPLVFVCENNYYAMSEPVERGIAAPGPDHWAARYDGFSVARVCGNDVEAVTGAFGPLAARSRSGGGPSFLECLTYRQCGHSRSDARVYRAREEERWWKERDPLRIAEERLALDEETIGAQRAGIEAEIDDAVAFALASPVPGADVARSGVLAPETFR